MADHENGVERTSRGADWEVVSLTSSAYAAAPIPSDLEHTNGGGLNENITEHESSAALFMSGHFVFPPSEHENLPVEPDLIELRSEAEGHNVSPGVADAHEELDDSGKVMMQSVSDDDMPSDEYFDKGSRISSHDMPADSSSDTLYFGEHKCETDEPSDMNMNMDSPHDCKKPDEDGCDGSNLPCQAWWTRHAVSLYHHAKESNTFWSVFVAAAVVGLVVLGRRWQQDKWQLQQTRMKLSVTDEKSSRVLGSIGWFKDVLIGSHHQPTSVSPGIGASASF